MAVYVSNLVINTGATFSQTFSLENISSNDALDLSGFTASSQMRKHPDSTNFVGIAVSITSPTEGKINISIADTITSNIKPGRHVYDVMLTRPSGSKIIGVEGSVLVRSGISTGCF